ncbi:MAG: NAD-dependent epimerase/dehydratase family protein [Pirellulaceae bacterium]|nr:NAD-dependent epimerase/dehydratase family protein [Pirellulaceae bacterium]MDP7019891.1 NAD-dependent epimerase/dehydratase family protein [Pirellulaceae bacterium]
MSAPRNVAELEDQLSAPPVSLLERFASIDGDIMFLGVGGKMGPTMARMARRAADEVGAPRRIIGVSRFSSPETRRQLEADGVETIACDLLDEAAVAQLPAAANVVFMSGFKFGSADNPALTWAMNCYAPATVSRRFRDSRIAAFSTGNVYPLCPPSSGGSREDCPLDPIGEYAMTALGRERMFQYFAGEFGFPLTLLRLNYATELRYGVLVDIAVAVNAETPLPLATGYVNVVWLGDANAMTLRALALDPDAPQVINLAGEPIVSVRDVALRFGEMLGKQVHFVGAEGETALLNDGRGGYSHLGHPETDIDTMIEWTADWVGRGGERLGKPTHFEVRDGKF